MKKVKTYVGGLLESWDSYNKEEEIDLVRERERETEVGLTIGAHLWAT